jgi:hypothetical protein
MSTPAWPCVARLVIAAPAALRYANLCRIRAWLQDRANLGRETWNVEREMRWSETSGRGGSHTTETTFWILNSGFYILTE